VGDPQKLILETRVNGELRQSSSTGDMIFTCAQIIAYVSSIFTLLPGDLISTRHAAGSHPRQARGAAAVAQAGGPHRVQRREVWRAALHPGVSIPAVERWPARRTGR
jgi:2-keto-4-pentenoate hydratase/2-oxohepta-3-ene-1,7-dioic acid hydratase in catechol pathway